MQRVPVAPRDDWKDTAIQHGFDFHSIDGDPYWDESAYYQFTLEQIENDLEDPVEELENLCFSVVERAVVDQEILERLAIPETYWGYVADSWRYQEKNFYGRMDFSYSGTGPAKLLEYNADTPTALYESSIFQWVWLEQAMERGLVPDGCDQFNSLHERIVEALSQFGIDGRFHLACASGSEEDHGTIAYLEDCAKQAGLETTLMEIETIGIDPNGRFTDPTDFIIEWLFKLYPWEWLFAEEFAKNIPNSGTHFIEPAWKTILSNKGLLPLLWEMYEGHPNLLPAYFEGDPAAAELGDTFVRKPLYSREGQNIELQRDGKREMPHPGDYGSEGHIVQAYQPLPEFNGNYPMVGCWLVASQPAGMCIREDQTLITGDDARFIPHLILD